MEEILQSTGNVLMVFVVQGEPPFPPDTMQCIYRASDQYGINTRQLLLGFLAILKVEGGRNGLKKRNYGVGERYAWDYGRSQTNSSNVERIARHYGRSYESVEHLIQHDECFNIASGAWLYMEAMQQKHNDFWAGVAAYHVGGNAKNSQRRAYRYQSQVYRHMLKMQDLTLSEFNHASQS